MSLVERALQRHKTGVKVDVSRDVDPTQEGVGAPFRPSRFLADGALDREIGDQSIVGHEFRVVKRPLLANALGQSLAKVRQGNLVQVTSPLAGAGKSFTSVNLAINVAAELDWSVILVDADAVKPRITTSLGIDGPGLIDLLLDERLTLADALVGTENPRLCILPAGPSTRSATELFASRRMERLLVDLGGSKGDCMVIFDSPPLLQTTEARVLTRHFGQILLVVEAGVTPRSAVLNALETIEPREERAISLVLNKYRPLGRLGAYGGEYGLYYGDDRNDTT